MMCRNFPTEKEKMLSPSYVSDMINLTSLKDHTNTTRELKFRLYNRYTIVEEVTCKQVCFDNSKDLIW